MGNAPRKGAVRQRNGPGGGGGGASAGCRAGGRARGASRVPGAAGAHVVQPVDGDVLYAANDLLQTSEAGLRALRDHLAADPEAFLLDNVLMAVQYFRNYEQETSALRMGVGMRGAPLVDDAAPATTTASSTASSTSLACRAERPDGLALAASRHVRWSRDRDDHPHHHHHHQAPATPLAAARRLVVRDNAVLHQDADVGALGTAPPCCCRRHDRHYHLAVEAAHRPGFIKLRRVRTACAADFRDDDDDDVAADPDEDAAERYLRPGPRREGTSSARDASPARTPTSTGSVASIRDRLQLMLQQQLLLQATQRHHLLQPPPAQYYSSKQRRAVDSADSVISSEGSSRASRASRTSSRGSGSLLSALSLSVSDLSSGSSSRLHPAERLVPLDEFRPGNACVDPDAVPEECFQSVLTQSAPQDASPHHDDEDDDDGGGGPSELRLHAYLMATPYFACFADAFHDRLAAAMGFPRESVVLATVRGGGAAAIQCDEHPDDPLGLGLPCDVTPALPLPGWPSAAAEWVYRDRGAWPSRSTVRAVHGLGGVAVPAACAHAQDPHAPLQWALAFPAGEQLLELSLPPRHAHGYLTLLALRRSLPGVSVDHLRALFLRQCERRERRDDPQDVPGPAADSSLGWAPGRALRASLDALYAALQQRHLPDYFVRDRNLLAEVTTSQVRRSQERVFRLRERLLPGVVHACRRLAPAAPRGTDHQHDFYPRLDFDKLVDLLCGHQDPQGGRQQQQQQQDGGRDRDGDWIANYRRHVEEASAREKAAAKQSRRPRLSQATIKLGMQDEDTRRRTAGVLVLFGEHFVGMAEASARFGAHEQAWLYLRHAVHLLAILDQDYGGEAGAATSRACLERVKRAERVLVGTAMTRLCGRASAPASASAHGGSLGDLSLSLSHSKPSWPRRQANAFGSVSVLSM